MKRTSVIDASDKSRLSVGFSPRSVEYLVLAWAKAHATRTSVIVCASLLLVGCGGSPAPSEPVSADVELQFSEDWEITEKPREEPLTDDEVQSFIELVRLLPDGKPPALTPVPGREGSKARTPEESVLAWRQGVRNALTVDTLMQGWTPRSTVQRALRERQVTPRALTSLMLRMSCAMAANAMGGSRQVAAQRVIADEKVESLVARIHQLERSRAKPSESLWEALGEAASLAEYLALLSEVPAESQQWVAAHQGDLKPMLPVTSNLSASPESREDHHITPIRFEEPERDARTSRR